MLQPGLHRKVKTKVYFPVSTGPSAGSHQKTGGKGKALEAAQKRQLDLRGFIEHLLAVERDLKQEEKFLAEIDRLVAENQNLNERFEQERARLAKREKELTEIYELLNGTLNDFMHLESVAKLASLGDFIHRMEITVDQFGNVIKSRRIQGA